MFLVLFETAMDKDAFVESLSERQEEGERTSWGVGFMRSFNDREIDGVVAFLHLLDSHVPH